MSSDIDIIITWVDDSDSEWISEKNKWLKLEKKKNHNKWAVGDNRYRDWDLLKYWFRGIEKYAPWVRTIHFVTCGHVPNWLNLDNSKLHIVKHSDYIPKKYLPTFNSHTIELNLHRIPGLADKFIYFNDDMFLLKNTKPEDFFKNGLPRDFAGLDLRTLDRKIIDYRPYNAMIISEHFSKKDVLRNNKGLWFSLKYGPKCLIKTLLLMPFGRFSALQTDHLPINFLKKTFVEVWSKETDILDFSCSQRFRGNFAVSPWLFRDWQRCKGEFIPKKPQLNSFIPCGKGYCSNTDDSIKPISKNECIKRITHPKGLGMICLNDHCSDNAQFYEWKDAVHNAFRKHFSNKSKFEL